MAALSPSFWNSLAVWADVPPGPAPAARRPLLENSEFLVACGLMALALFGGAFVLSYFDRRRKRMASASDSAALLERYREMYEDGEITESEYHRVRAQVAGQMRTEVGLTDLPKPTPPKPPDPSAT